MMSKAARSPRLKSRAGSPIVGVRASSDLCANGHPVPCRCPDPAVTKETPDSDSLLELVDKAGILVLVIDLNGRVLRFSHALEEATGWRREDAFGVDWFENFTPPDARERLRRACLGSSSGERELGQAGPLLQRDGTERMIEWIHSDLCDDQGLRLGLLCIGRDVTDLQNVTDALRASEERNRGILETAVNAIITINERGIIESVNPATERLFGYAKDEMVGRNVSMLMPSPYRDQHDTYLHNYHRTGVAKIIGIGRETMAQRKDGTVFPADLSVGEVRLPQGKVFTGIIRDISDRKRLEQEILEISEKEQQRIGQDIHDDLCQQLAAISCLAQVVNQRLQTENNPEAQSMAEIVRLISQANTRARMMSRGLVPVVLDAGGLMSALSELATGTEKIFRISCRFWCEQPVLVDDNVVAVQLYRIAQEAVANALKHSGADRVEILLSIEDQAIRLRIRDNGIGFPEEIPHTAGSGMGLLTMTHRAKMLGGHLTVMPEPSGGTEVCCLLPVAAHQKKCPSHS